MFDKQENYLAQSINDNKMVCLRNDSDHFQIHLENGQIQVLNMQEEKSQIVGSQNLSKIKMYLNSHFTQIQRNVQYQIIEQENGIKMIMKNAPIQSSEKPASSCQQFENFYNFNQNDQQTQNYQKKLNQINEMANIIQINNQVNKYYSNNPQLISKDQQQIKPLASNEQFVQYRKETDQKLTDLSLKNKQYQQTIINLNMKLYQQQNLLKKITVISQINQKTINKCFHLYEKMEQIQKQSQRKSKETSSQYQKKLYSELQNTKNQFKAQIINPLSQLIQKQNRKIQTLQKVFTEKSEAILKSFKESQFKQSQIQIQKKSCIANNHNDFLLSFKPKGKNQLLGHYHNNADRKQFLLIKNQNSIDIIHQSQNAYFNFINRQRLVEGQYRFSIKLKNIKNKNLFVGIGTKSTFNLFDRRINFPEYVEQGIFYCCGAGWIHKSGQFNQINQRTDKGDELLVDVNLERNKFSLTRRGKNGQKQFYDCTIPQQMATRGLYLIVRMFYNQDQVQISSL